MHYDYLAGEPGRIEMRVVGHHEDPATAWSGFTKDARVVDYDNNAATATISSVTVGAATANADDATLFDFDLSCDLPLTLAAGMYYVQFRVRNGSDLDSIFPVLRNRLTLRVWPAPT